MPITSAAASAANPALTWTTVPPAKFRTPSLNNQPFGDQIMRTSGPWISISHSAVKARKDENYIRSAKAPTINAGVITANMHWTITKDRWGILPIGSEM